MVTIEHTSIEAIVQAQKILTQIKMEHWLSKEVFSMQWWIQCVVLVPAMVCLVEAGR